MKKVVFTFGRMNPPTIGHEKLVNKLKAIASKEKADARIYLSHTNKPGSDPLSYNDKIKFAQKAFGIAYKSKARQIFQIAKELQGQKYTDIVMVVGSDRVKEFDTLLKKYNNKGDYNFDSIKVVSAGQRDPDAKGVEGMSGTKLRNLAKDGDMKTFMKGLASGLSASDKKKVYALVSKNMNEAIELDEKPMTVQQRVARGRLMKRLAPKLAKARAKKAKRMADPRQLKIRAQKAAMVAVRKKVAGEKGINYATLSPSDKMNVDKLVAKIKGLVAKIAKKLLPVVRKKEQARLKALHGKVEGFEISEEAEISLRNKATKSQISYDIIKEIYDRGLLFWEETGSMDEQQYAFARINSFISGGKTRETIDVDLWEQHMNEVWYNDLWSKIDRVLHPRGWDDAIKQYVQGMTDKGHRVHPSAWAADVARQYKGLNGRQLIKYINKLITKGQLPKELKANYVTEETIEDVYNPDEDFGGKAVLKKKSVEEDGPLKRKTDAERKLAKKKKDKWAKTAGGKKSALKSKKRADKVKSGAVRVDKARSKTAKKTAKLYNGVSFKDFIKGDQDVT